MAVDFEDQKERKYHWQSGHFFFQPALLLTLYFHLQYAETGEISAQQLLGCIFASALARYPSFLPLFVEKALFPAFTEEN